MKKSLFILLVALMAAFGASAQITADWKLHLPFDAWPTQVIETPTRVYFTSGTYQQQPNVPMRANPSNSLYYYDKKGDEVVSVNTRNIGNGNAVSCMAYNVNKQYLLVIYTDCNIDFIYDDGRVFNLPALQVTAIPGKKQANYINFDHHENRAYVATSFGYLALNDRKHEVAESRNYGTNVQSVATAGGQLIMCIDGKIYFAPVASLRYNLEDYKMVEDGPEIDAIVPTYSDNFFAYKTGYNSYLGIFRKEGDNYKWTQFFDDPRILGVQQVYGGHRITGNVRLYFTENYGNINWKPRPESEYGNPAATFDGNTIWSLTPRKGLRSFKVNDTWDWTLTRDYIRPNSPATYIATSMAYHPTYGIMAGSNGYDLALNDFNQATPANISALKGGLWKELGAPYASTGLSATNNYFGLSLDPLNNNYAYRASALGGLMRVNLANPNDVLVMANPSNANASCTNFIPIAEDQQTWNRLCRFSTPRFAADGTMWTLYNNADMDRAELWYWPSADRAATTSAATYRPMKKINLTTNFPNGNRDEILPLTQNKNIIVIGGYEDGGRLMFYDHNGTPNVTSDDRYVMMENPYDQDGGVVEFLSINSLHEDPSSGLVWIMSQRGLFTVNPATVFDNPNQVNRIKVARNDGTNLADYLLNEINVNNMSVDGEGRKWFSTSNGLVCTSRDGRSILGEFTTDNSYLPNDNIYVTCYNPDNNSLLVGTDGGLVEMFPSGSGSSTTDQSGMRVYPNPVEPDFYGWVRIDNVADGSLVKITDSKGGVVKELGPVQGGSVQWDVAGTNNSRVSTGVYYIMVSPGSGGGKSEISKILVLN